MEQLLIGFFIVFVFLRIFQLYQDYCFYKNLVFTIKDYKEGK